MNTAPLIIAGVAVLAVAGYMVYQQQLQLRCEQYPSSTECVERSKRYSSSNSTNEFGVVLEEPSLMTQDRNWAQKRYEQCSRSCIDLIPSGMDASLASCLDRC